VGALKDCSTAGVVAARSGADADDWRLVVAAAGWSLGWTEGVATARRCCCGAAGWALAGWSAGRVTVPLRLKF
jgi:hypothetical protein